MTTPPIQFVDVTKEYQGHRTVDSLCLEFNSGTTVGLLGPNGAGKTTCLKMMLGLLRPTSGSISILGQDVVSNGPQVRQQIGYVPEDPWLYPWMTVRQVIRFASSMYKSWDDSRATELLGQFELPPDRIIKKLSKGMRVKAALVVALAHRPQVLVLDEPMSGLDPLMRDDLIETLLSARAENTECIVLSSHQIDDVNRLADEVAIINEGKLLVHSSIDDLLGSTKRVEAVLLDGRLPEKPLPQTVWQNIDRRNWSMTVHPFDETMLDALQADNPISSARIVDLSVEQIFKDMIRGATPPCFAH